MLGKLIKYEFKSTSRVMWYLYGGLIIVGILLGVFLRIQSVINADPNQADYYDPIFSMFESSGNPVLRVMVTAFGLIYVLMIQAVAIMTTIMIITRFNKNLLGGEGYLMHTLPVKTHSLILSKGIIAMIWMAIGFLAGVLSALMLGLTSGALQYILKELDWEMVREIIAELFRTETFLFILFTIVSGITSILTFYISMAIGNLANKNKFLFAVLAYLGIGMAMTIMATIVSVAAGGMFSWIFEEGAMNLFLILQILVQVVLGVGFFIGTNYILKNKLNLA